MNQSTVTNISIYIPRMNINHTEFYVKNVFQTIHKFGIVKRIDFTAINKKPGFVENIGIYKSAFIHFENKNNSQIKHIKNFWNSIEQGNSYRVEVDNSDDNNAEYWICLKNKSPVKTTLMNIHQVVENGRYLENLIAEQGKQIEEQSNTIKNLQMMLESLLTIDKRLFDDEQQDNNLCNRKRITQYTNQNTNARITGDDDEEFDSLTISTHSSILPQLEEHDIFELDSNETTDRVKNSCELCGNE